MSFKDYLVFGSESQSYQTRSGDTVNKFLIHYLDPKTVLSNQLELGSMPLQKDIIAAGSVNPSVFADLPGYYELKFRGFSQRIGRDVKVSQKLVDANRTGSFTLPTCTVDPDAYLLLYAKFYNIHIDGKNLKGSKLFYLDPSQDCDNFGYHLNSISCSSTVLNVKSCLVKVPGYYLLDFSDVRGVDGDASLRLDTLEFVKEVDLANSSSSTVSSTYSYANS